ncbi:MAG TPA: primosomal protein N' [Candidatus Binatia bacterium]|nr:primosomal protein N' [Candidatus Binatia bacterium]
MEALVEIAPVPPVPRHDLLTYDVPALLRSRVQPGVRVRIPLGRQVRTGVVAGFATSSPPGGARSILEVLDVDPFLPADLLELARWTARYYLASLAEVIAAIVPAGVPSPARERVFRLVDRDAPMPRGSARARAHAALVAAGEAGLAAGEARAAGVTAAALRALVAAGVAEAVARDRARVADPPTEASPRPVLTAAQQTAVGAIVARLAGSDGGSLLLHGVTGSGKTEVYLAAAERALAAGRAVIMLVPEIALTHQLVERVRGRFGATTAVLHSGLGPRERWTEWRRIAAGEARVVVGARSAVFAPAARLGLLVVDEEHDPAYKQEEGLRYNARDLSVVRARLARAVVVLASATPSAETYHAAREGRHVLLELHDRPTAHALPAVELVDLRTRQRDAAEMRFFSARLRAAVEANLGRGQTLVFLNRRGFAVYLQCTACGTAVSCPHCSVTLAWHRAAGALVCHHCRHTRRTPATCPECRHGALEAFGAGTEQIEAALRACYPVASVGRLDRDAARRPGAQRRILEAWRAGDTDILVGTQMVSKGHDVPGVTLVAVLLADLSLNVPDFRAAERTFQLLVQVAGRAGRGDEPGSVVVQTFRPTHPSLAAAAGHDYAGFMAGELARRRALGYPPFARLVNLRLDGRDPAAVERSAREVAARLRGRARTLGLGEDAVLGPAPPPIERVRGRYRWQVLLRSADVRALRALARHARDLVPAGGSAAPRLVIDVDPYTMF